MYDQALTIFNEKKRWMANFRYEVNSNKGWETLSTGDYDEFDSVCRQTMVGIVQDRDTKEFHCMKGKKISPDKPTSIKDDRATVAMAQTSSSGSRHGMMSLAQTAVSILTSDKPEPE